MSVYRDLDESEQMLERHGLSDMSAELFGDIEQLLTALSVETSHIATVLHEQHQATVAADPHLALWRETRR